MEVCTGMPADCLDLCASSYKAELGGNFAPLGAITHLPHPFIQARQVPAKKLAR